MRTSISRLSALLMIAALLIGGCESDKTVTPVVVPDSYINLYISDQTIFAPAGMDISRPIVAEVISDEGAPVSGIRVSFRLLAGSGRFESISAVTDSQGIASSVLRTTLLRGAQKLTFSVSTASATARQDLHFIGTGQPTSLSITEPVEPVVVPPTTPARINLRAHLTDANGAAVEGIPLKYSLVSWYGGIFGSISGDSLSRKDGSILISFEALAEFGREYIVASTDTLTWKGAFVSDTVLIEVRRKVEQTLTFTVRLTPNTVDPLDSVRIGVQAKDENNIGVPDIEIRFSTDFGILTINSPTDSAGIASAILKSNGTSGLANVRIWAPGYDFDRTIQIHLVASAGASLQLTSDRDFIYADDGVTSANLSALVFDSNRVSVPGAIVEFSTSEGVITRLGNTTARLVGLNQDDSDTLTAMVIASYGDAAADTVYIEIRPVVRRIYDMTLTYTRDPSYDCVFARIADQFGHPISSNQMVSFGTEPRVLLRVFPTDSNGVAKAQMSHNADPSPIIVSARWNDLYRSITIPGAERLPNNISVTNDGGPLSPPGTGGDSVMVFTVEVRDQFDDLFEPPIPVMVQLIDSPQPPVGAHWEGGGTLDSAVTEHGRATVRLFSGQRIGGILIRAFTWRDWDAEHAGADGIPRTEAMSVTISTVAVVAGPPYSIDIDLNEAAQDGGDSLWRLPVSVRLYDVHRNPISDQVALNPSLDPPIAEIQPGSTWDTFFIVYRSDQTGQQTMLELTINTPNGPVVGQRAIQLPLQQGALSLQVDPQNWMFDRANPNDTATFRVWAVLTDGHGNAINNMPILFRTDRQRFYWKNLRLNGRYIQFFPEVARRYTGFVNAENNEPAGTATVYLRGVMGDVYLDDFTLEVTIHVEASVEGSDITADPAFIFLTRH